MDTGSFLWQCFYFFYSITVSFVRTMYIDCFLNLDLMYFLRMLSYSFVCSRVTKFTCFLNVKCFLHTHPLSYVFLRTIIVRSHLTFKFGGTLLIFLTVIIHKSFYISLTLREWNYHSYILPCRWYFLYTVKECFNL